MEMDPETKLVEKTHRMSVQELLESVDPLLLLRSEMDTAHLEVLTEVERLGLTIESIDVTFDVQVRAYAK